MPFMITTFADVLSVNNGTKQRRRAGVANTGVVS